MDIKVWVCACKGVRLPLFAVAMFLLIISSGVSRQVYAATFEQQVKENYENCKKIRGPNFTSQRPETLNADCEEVGEKLKPQQKPSPEYEERKRTFLQNVQQQQN
jgi:DNA-binding transcriptional regulator GbsR (MarR family)